ncbi:MAG: hypothetical protein M1491_05750, partial [Deltaproteobacteria bacterium]|nr:hypothetical protein [Deltaproteobacteria bacterium]
HTVPGKSKARNPIGLTRMQEVVQGMTLFIPGRPVRHGVPDRMMYKFFSMVGVAQWWSIGLWLLKRAKA